MKKELVRWKCNCGATLGVVQRQDINRKLRVRMLLVLEAPLHKMADETELAAAVQTARVEIRGEGWVLCGHCGRWARWLSAEHGMQKLLERTSAAKNQGGGKGLTPNPSPQSGEGMRSQASAGSRHATPLRKRNIKKGARK